MQYADVHLLNLTDETEAGVLLPHPYQISVHTGNTDGGTTRLFQTGDELFVD